MASDRPETTMVVSPQRRLEMALEMAAGTAAGAMEDLDQMKRWHPPSKRGSNYSRYLESLERRLAAIETHAREALADGR